MYVAVRRQFVKFVSLLLLSPCVHQDQTQVDKLGFECMFNYFFFFFGGFDNFTRTTFI